MNILIRSYSTASLKKGTENLIHFIDWSYIPRVGEFLNLYGRKYKIIEVHNLMQCAVSDVMVIGGTEHTIEVELMVCSL